MRCFDSEVYKREQLKGLRKRMRGCKRFYLEMGGKSFCDGHASRVLPGYRKEIKAEILKELGDCEFVYCINARDLCSKKLLGGVGFERAVWRDLNGLKKRGFDVRHVLINRYKKGMAKDFVHKLLKRGYGVYFHREIKGYLESVRNVFRGFDKMEYIPVEKKIVVFVSPGGGSGKMASIMNQIYHERKIFGFRNQGYAKFESFPVWNLGMNSRINLAYEAATADLGDELVIDRQHKKEYGVEAVNYNRDVWNFRILKELIKKTGGGRWPFGYRSVTDMGVNMIKKGIVDLKCCERAAEKEILRRYRVYKRNVEKGFEKRSTLRRMKEIMKKAGLQ